MEEDHREHEHWKGNKNKFIRYYFYMTRGLDVFNSFRYVIMAIFGVYYTLHLHQPLWLLAMFLGSIPILIIVGHYSIHHVGKVIDWLNIRFGTHYSLYQIKLLENIRDAIKSKAHA